MNVLFFDDEFRNPTNIVFRLEIEEVLPEARVTTVHNVSGFDSAMRATRYRCIVLDVMTPETNVVSFADGRIVGKAQVGIELLKRIRSGQVYTRQERSVLVIMRTARTIEMRVRMECEAAGATCLRPGHDDMKIIEMIMAEARNAE